MQDRTPIYPGRVKLTPVTGQENTYDMERADQPTQEGTKLNKANLLDDATAAKYGLDSSAVPNDVLSLLSRFNSGLGNEYVWSKSTDILVDVVVLSSDTTTVEIPITSPEIYATASVVDGEVVLSNQISTHYKSAAGFYAYYNGSPYYLDAFESSSDTAKYSANLLSVGQGYTKKVVGYVNSPDPTTYPPAVSDGFTYTPLGQLCAKMQTATGSYTGTGTKDSSNPNSLTFDFAPKFLFIVAVYDNLGKRSYAYNDGIMVDSISCERLTTYYLEGAGFLTDTSHPGSAKKSSDGRTISWYNDYSSNRQYNNAGYTYYYIAIG